MEFLEFLDFLEIRILEFLDEVRSKHFYLSSYHERDFLNARFLNWKTHESLHVL